MTDRATAPVRVNHPRRLPAWQIPAQRIAMGPGYKPCMAQLPDGELVMIALFGDRDLPGGKVREWTGLWRSKDGGLTWTERVEVRDMIGREHWLTCLRDGTLITSCHLLPQDVNNPEGICSSWLHRSTDGGRSWERTRATVDGELRCGADEKLGSGTSRNVVELPEGTLLFGVSIGTADVAYLWRSDDGGKTWEKNRPVKIQGFYHNADGFFAEDFNYRNDSGKLLHWCRVGPFGYRPEQENPPGMFPMNDGRPAPTGDDGIDRMMWTHSSDEGLTWAPLLDFGDYGSHYPRVVRLHDGRLLMTYTQRSTFYPLGLRAILSYDDGETWDFSADQIVIEGFTPWGQESGGGFGNTIQLPDGSLATCYSYNSGDTRNEIDVVRWRMP